MRISLRLPGVDGIRVDGGSSSGFADVIFITFQDAGDRSEFSQHIRDHHVLDLELGRGLNAIDRPRTGARFGLNNDKPRLFEFGRFAIACGAHIRRMCRARTAFYVRFRQPFVGEISVDVISYWVARPENVGSIARLPQ